LGTSVMVAKTSVFGVRCIISYTVIGKLFKRFCASVHSLGDQSAK
jgi:hypothetical protein